MNELTTLGVDLAKNVFQVHGVAASGETAVKCFSLNWLQDTTTAAPG